jgi:hypothetical protein
MGEVLEAWLDFPDRVVELSVINMASMQAKRKQYPNEEAWPMCIAHALGAHEVHLWPTPHKAGNVRIRYYPVPQVI